MGAEFGVRVAGAPTAKIFIRCSVNQIFAQQALDGIGNEGRGATIADGARYRCMLAYGSAEAEVVGVGQLAFVLDLFAFDADVGNPVLAAAVGASGYVELELLVECGQALFELID